MTEGEWLTTDECFAAADCLLCMRMFPVCQVLRHGRRPGTASRKFRLACAAMCRLMRDDEAEKEFKYAIFVAEYFADGALQREDLKRAHRGVASTLSLADRLSNRCAAGFALTQTVMGPRYVGVVVRHALEYLSRQQSKEVIRPGPSAPRCPVLVNLLRDVVGNLFAGNRLPEARCRVCETPIACTKCPYCHAGRRGGSAHPWLFDPVASIAKTAYAQSDPVTGRLSSLDLQAIADLMEDRGCPQDDPFLTHLRSPLPHVKGCWAIDLILNKA